MEQAVSDLCQQRFRPHEHIPRIPPLDPSEVDPERAEGKDANHERPGVDGTDQPPRNRVDEEERGQAQQQPGPGRGRQEQDVIQERNGSAAVAEVLQVGDDVRRVGEEQQPERAEDAEHRERSA